MAAADFSQRGARDLVLRSVPATPENVTEVRHAVCEFARRAGAGEVTVADVALAVGEACGNAVMHAYPPGQSGPLVVTARVQDQALVVDIADRGSGLAPRRDSQGLGLGLPLMSTLSSDMRIGSGPDGVGTEIQLTFPLAS